MRNFVKRLTLGLVLLILIGLPIYAQQVNQLTTGTGGVGRLLIGLGTEGAATLVNARTTLTNAQVLALNATSVSVVAAPGAGFVIDVLEGVLVFNYTAAYTVGAADDLALYIGSNSRGIRMSNTIETTGFLNATADTILAFSGTPNDTRPTANAAVHIYNTSGVAFGSGNASNQVFVDVTYMIRRTGL